MNMIVSGPILKLKKVDDYTLSHVIRIGTEYVRSHK